MAGSAAHEPHPGIVSDTGAAWAFVLSLMYSSTTSSSANALSTYVSDRPVMVVGERRLPSEELGLFVSVAVLTVTLLAFFFEGLPRCDLNHFWIFFKIIKDQILRCGME